VYLLDTNTCIQYSRQRDPGLIIQIAAIALAESVTLVTHNTGEFSRIPGLQIEDWQTIP
jgi:predicted nucleic acid-binding protein